MAKFVDRHDRIFVNYHFRVTDIIVPYLGAFIGAAWNDRDVTGTLGPQGGVKFFVMSRRS